MFNRSDSNLWFKSSLIPWLEFLLPVCEYDRFSWTCFLGVTPERFEKNNQFWKNQVHKYWSFLGVEKTTIRNVMDMNANYGGFAAALSSDPVWIMNIVPHTMTNTLPVIYNRGLLGSYHDWLVFLPNSRNFFHLFTMKLKQFIHAAGVSHSQHILDPMTCCMLSTSFLIMKVARKIVCWRISC